MLNEAVLAVLVAEVEDAKRAHNAAKEDFWSVAGVSRELPGMPTVLPHPDGGEQIRRAVYAENYARQAHVEAILRLNRFLLDGTIPDDVREKLAHPSRSAGVPETSSGA